MNQNDQQRPTPETQDFHSTVKGTPLEKYWSAIGKCEQFERERDEARTQADNLAKQLEAMREAIREAHRVLENALFVHQAITTYAPQDAVDKIENQKHCDNMRAALAKLQPFINP